MARIDVAFGAEHRIRQASQTVYKHFLAGRQVLVYCTDKMRLNAFSKALWGVEKTAFVPHPYWDISLMQKQLPHVSVYLCHDITEAMLDAWTEGELPWLLNLDVQCPPFSERFERILEIVSEHPADKDLARERMQHYKKAGHQMVYHQL